MAKFAFISPEACTLPWWIRLISEGHDVRVWIHSEKQRRIGDGLVEKAPSLESLVRWGGKEAIYVFDYTSKGIVADQLARAGYKVVGGGSFLDKLESNRRFGEQVASVLGVRLPKHKEFSTLHDAITWLRRRPEDEQWFFKPHGDIGASKTYGAKDVPELIAYLEYLRKSLGDRIPGILQERINGVVIDTCAWWNGERFIPPFIGMVEYKKFMPGDVGPSTGAEISWVWAYAEEEPRISRELHFQDLEEMFRRMKVPPGEYGINAIVDARDRRPYFLEWDPRFGYDEDIVYLPGIRGDFGEALSELASGRLERAPFEVKETWLGVRLSVPPYPWEEARDDKSSPVGTPVLVDDELIFLYGVQYVDRKLVIADPFGLVGVAVEVGNDMKEMRESIYERIREVRVPNLQYRVDAGSHKETRDFTRLKEWGYEVPPLRW